MQELSLGAVYSPALGVKEGTSISFDGAGLVLLYNYKNPTPEEIKNVSEGSSFEIRLLVKGGALWVFTKCGNMNWEEAIYTPHLNSYIKDLQRPEGGLGYALTLMMLDANDATIKHMRLIGLGEKFSAKLYDAIQELRAAPFDEAKYNQTLQDMQALYDTNDLVKMAKGYYKLH